MSIWGRSGVDMGSIWGRYGVDLGLILVRHGVDLGSLWGKYGVDMGSIWFKPLCNLYASAVIVRLPMSKPKAEGAGSSGASQPAASRAAQSRASISAASQPAAPGAKQRVPHARLWKQTTAALLSLLERESLLTPHADHSNSWKGCPKRPEGRRRTSNDWPKLSVKPDEQAN